MGTNFYLVRDTDAPTCTSCGENPTAIHIGKSSAGWVFLWRGYLPGESGATNEGHYGDVLPYLTGPGEWFAFLVKRCSAGWWIKNEYGERQDLEEFQVRVESMRGAGRRVDEVVHAEARLQRTTPEGDSVAFYTFR